MLYIGLRRRLLQGVFVGSQHVLGRKQISCQVLRHRERRPVLAHPGSILQDCVSTGHVALVVSHLYLEGRQIALYLRRVGLDLQRKLIRLHCLLQIVGCTVDKTVDVPAHVALHVHLQRRFGQRECILRPTLRVDDQGLESCSVAMLWVFSEDLVGGPKTLERQ